MNITRILSEAVNEINLLSDSDIKCIRHLIFDYFSAAFAGYKQNKELNTALETLFFEQGGKAESAVFMSGKKLPAQNAAFMNAAYAHGAEMDDGSRKAMGHAGVHIISAVFALADAMELPQKDVLIAIAAGYEVYLRIAAAAQPGMVKRGFHSTGMAGAPACAAACARLLNLGAEGIENAISLACTMSSGLLTVGDSRQMVKPLNPAKAAQTGVLAALLVRENIKGPFEALESPNGWFHAVSEEINENMLFEGLGTKLLLHECYIKCFPSCRHTHCGIEAAINLHSKVNSDEIDKINVYIYPNAIHLAGQIRYPKTKDETKFSICYTLACAIYNGSYGIDDMEPENAGREITDLIEKITLIPDEEMENREKGIRGTRVEVILKNNTKITETVLIPKGDPEKPLTENDLKEKMKSCAFGVISEEEQSRIFENVMKLGGDSPFIYKNLMI